MGCAQCKRYNTAGQTTCRKHGHKLSCNLQPAHAILPTLACLLVYMCAQQVVTNGSLKAEGRGPPQLNPNLNEQVGQQGIHVCHAGSQAFCHFILTLPAACQGWRGPANHTGQTHRTDCHEQSTITVLTAKSTRNRNNKSTFFMAKRSTSN